MTTIETKAKTKISDGRAEILRALFDRAAEVTELPELERTGIHDKNGIDNAAAIDYLGEEITGLAGKLSGRFARSIPPNMRDKKGGSRHCRSGAMILRTTGCGTRHHPQAISSARWTNGSRPGTVGRLPEAVHCHELLTRISPPLGQFAGTGIGLRRLDRTERSGCNGSPTPTQSRRSVCALP